MKNWQEEFLISKKSGESGHESPKGWGAHMPPAIVAVAVGCGKICDAAVDDKISESPINVAMCLSSNQCENSLVMGGSGNSESLAAGAMTGLPEDVKRDSGDALRKPSPRPPSQAPLPPVVPHICVQWRVACVKD